MFLQKQTAFKGPDIMKCHALQLKRRNILTTPRMREHQPTMTRVNNEFFSFNFNNIEFIESYDLMMSNNFFRQ